MKTIIKMTFILALALLMNSCKKNQTNGSSTMTVMMTDASGNFTAVNIDLQAVGVTPNSGNEVMINTHPGIYNLLNFSNGMDTMIATGTLQAQSVEQIRLILGPNNSVVVNGVSYPLSTPSAQESGLKVQIHQDLQAGVSYIVLLDFDANQSIVQEGNGTYQLKPVIRAVTSASTGSITGSISALGIIANVTATANGVSYSSVTNMNGQFVIAGVPAGSYSVTISPPSPLVQVTVNDVVVATGQVTSMGVVKL